MYQYLLTHGFFRTLYHVRNEDSLITEKFGGAIIGMMLNMIMFPMTIYDDFCHLERYLRGMPPCPPVISPWIC